MLFSRKNAAIIAAFVAPSALAQTTSPSVNPQNCQNAGTASFNLAALAGTGGTLGDLAIQVTTGAAACTVGTAQGKTITGITGTLGTNQVTFLPGTTTGDDCLLPCAPIVLSNTGTSFTTTTGGVINTYRLRSDGTTGVQVYIGAGTAAQTSTVNSGNACNAPSAGAAVCPANAEYTCASTVDKFYNFVGSDGAGGTFSANFVYTNNPCGTVAPAGGVQGLQVIGLTGTYQQAGQTTPERLTLSQTGATAPNCFYPCSTLKVDTQGVRFTVTPANTGVAGGVQTFFSFPAPAGGSAGYRITPTTGTPVTITETSSGQSCAAGLGGFFVCPAVVSSTSSSIISTSVPGSVSISIISSTSIPTIPVTSAASTTVVGISSVPTSVSSASLSPVSSTAVVTSAASSVTTGSPTSSTVAIATGPQTSLPTPFVITVTVRVTRKRQAVQYVGDGGALTTDPAAAAVFQLINGQLFSDGQIVSTGPAIPAQQPLDGGAQGTITTVWTSNAGAIAWTNAVFANGAATFCVANNIVNTVFVAAPAVGCVPVALAGVPVSAVVPAVPSGAAAGGITINNNFNPTIGVIVTVNLVLGTSTLGNGSVITTTGLSSTTSPLYANPSGDAYCLKCALPACPNSGNVVYTTACGACVAYTAPPAAVVTCNTCAPVALPTAGPVAPNGDVPAAPAGPAGPAGTAGVAPVPGTDATFTGSAVTFGINAVAVMVAGAALLL